MDSYYDLKQEFKHLYKLDLSLGNMQHLASPGVDLMDWSSVDYFCIIVMFLSDGTYSLQSIHCWERDEMLHFNK